MRFAQNLVVERALRARTAMSRLRRVAPGALLSLVLTPGCIAHERPDVTPLDFCEREQLQESTTIDQSTSGLDVVIVVDDSIAMAGLDDIVRIQVHDAIAHMASGDDNGDGRREVVPERSIRVSVLDMDMGVLDATSDPSCPAGGGDAAMLRTSASDCATTSADPNGVLTFTQGGPVTPARFADDVACAMHAGTGGCRYARGMDALVAALDPARGLIRPDAQVFLVVVTAQDDCSTTSAGVFSSASPTALRCHDGAALLTPVETIADTLAARLPRPELVTLAIVGGFVPLMGGSAEAALADPAMDEHVDPTAPDRLTPVCTLPTAAASPSRRWAELAVALESRGVHSTLESLCSPWGHVFDHWIGNDTIDGICVGSLEGLDSDAAGRLRCDVTLTLPAVGTGALVEHCRDLPSPEAYMLDHVEPSGAEVCRIRQIARETDGALGGWSTAPRAPCDAAIALSRLALRVGRLDVSCDLNALPTNRPHARRGMECEGEDGQVRCAMGHALDGDATTVALGCDAFTRSCQIPCTSDADCGAIDDALRCDLRSPSAYFETTPPSGLPATRGFCLDPSCDPADR